MDRIAAYGEWFGRLEAERPVIGERHPSCHLCHNRHYQQDRDPVIAGKHLAVMIARVIVDASTTCGEQQTTDRLELAALGSFMTRRRIEEKTAVVVNNCTMHDRRTGSVFYPRFFSFQIPVSRVGAQDPKIRKIAWTEERSD